MATFQRADSTVEKLVSRMLFEHYPQLHELASSETKVGKVKRNELTFDLLMVHADLDGQGEPVGPPLKHQGRTAAAVIKATSKADRALGRGDVEIRIDGDYWGKLDDAQREALIDHELHHLILKLDDGVPKRDDLGRPTFKMREHDYDFGWFAEIAKRHGAASLEVQQAKLIMKRDGQHLFSFVEQPELGGSNVVPMREPEERAPEAAAIV